MKVASRTGRARLNVCAVHSISSYRPATWVPHSGGSLSCSRVQDVSGLMQWLRAARRARICLLFALFGKTREERRPLIMVAVGFGTVLVGHAAVARHIQEDATGLTELSPPVALRVDWQALLLIMSFATTNPAWDVALDAVLLWIGTLNAVFGTQDIYDDTIIRGMSALTLSASLVYIQAYSLQMRRWHLVPVGHHCVWAFDLLVSDA